MTYGAGKLPAFQIFGRENPETDTIDSSSERLYIMQNIANRLLPILAVTTLGMSINDAHSSSNVPGSGFKAAFGSQSGCLSRYTGYADVRNNCGYAVEIAGFLPVVTAGWYPTKVVMYGNNSWCQSVSTNGVGNGAQIGAAIWTSAGPQTWQVLNLGDRYVWTWAALAFRCSLEPGGIIGEYGTDAS